MILKVTFVNPYFPPYAPGGAEYSLQLLCQHLTAAGVDVRVLTNCFDGKPRVRDGEGFEIEYLSCPIIGEPGQNIDASGYVFSSRYQQRVVDTLMLRFEQGLRSDILIANNASCFIPVAEAGRNLKVPSVGIVRDTQVICETGTCIDNKSASKAIPCSGISGAAMCRLFFERNRGNKRIVSIVGMLLNGIRAGIQRKRTRKYGVCQLSHLVTISNALRRLLINGSVATDDTITTIGNFSTQVTPSPSKEVDSYLSDFELRPHKYFLMAGKKSYGKGNDVAIRAIQELQIKRKDIKLLMVGKGHVSAKKDNTFRDNPPVSQELLMGLLRKSIALIVPGRWQEGLHRTMVDAIRYGVPVVCTESGGPAENIINDQTGYIVPCDSYIELSKALHLRLDWSDEKLIRCTTAAKKIYERKFSTSVIIYKWINLLNTISYNSSVNNF